MTGDQKWKTVHTVLFENVGLVSRERVIEFSTQVGALLVSREVGDEGRPHYHLAIMLKDLTPDKVLRDLIKSTFSHPGVKYKRNELYNLHDWNRKPDDTYLEEYICKGKDKGTLPDVVFSSFQDSGIITFHSEYWRKKAIAERASAAAAKNKADDKSRQAQKIIQEALVHFRDDIHPREPFNVLEYVIDQLEGSRDDREHALIAQRILFILDKKATRVAMATRIFNRFFT